MPCLFRLLHPVLFAVALLVPLQAKAFEITVDGVTYELSVAHISYTSNTALFEAQPWWSSFDTTITYVNAFTSAGGNTFVDFSLATVFFPHSFTGFSVNSIEVSGWMIEGLATSGPGSTIHYVTATVVPAVPEIDGNALAKALFILFALGAWLHTRRRRLG